MSTITQVQNYQGANSFVIKMKDAIKKYGTLTPKQLAAEITKQIPGFS